MINIDHKICLSIIIIIIGYLIIKKTVLNNNQNIESFETTELKELKDYKKDGLKEIADELNVKYKKDISIMELYYKIKLKLNDNKWEKLEKSRRQKELVVSKNEKNKKKEDIEDMKEYQKSLEDFIEYQNKQNNKIDLYSIGKDVEGGINEIVTSFEKLMSSNKEGFQDISSKKEYYEKLNNLYNYKNQLIIYLNSFLKKDRSSKKYSDFYFIYQNINKDYNDLKKNNPFEKKTTKKEEEQNVNEIDDNILDFLKYIFEEIYNISLKKINIFDNSNNNHILKFFKNDIFKNDRTLIGGGVLLIIISLGLYFIDLSM